MWRSRDAAWWGRLALCVAYILADEVASDAELFIYRFLCYSRGHVPHLCPGSYRVAAVRIEVSLIDNFESSMINLLRSTLSSPNYNCYGRKSLFFYELCQEQVEE
jgi:hypothetical protein